jgi:hypothetical protein
MHTCPLCHYEAESAFDLLKHMSMTPRGPNLEPKGHGWRVPESFLKAVSDESYKSGFPNTSGTFDVGGLEVEVKPINRGKTRETKYGRVAVRSAEHRILVRCPECNKKIPVGRLHQHVIVHGGRNKPCPVCGKEYGTGNHLRAHIRNVHGAHSPLQRGESRPGRY